MVKETSIPNMAASTFAPPAGPELGQQFVGMVEVALLVYSEDAQQAFICR